MSKKNFITLTLTFLAVAGFYLYMYWDSFHKPVIQISHSIRPIGWRRVRKGATQPEAPPEDIVTFRMQQDFKLTSVRVVPIPQLTTNKYARAVWEMITDSNSIPTQAFAYGNGIRGMHPAIKGARPDPLEPNVPYRLFVQAGKIEGHHDFTVSEDAKLAQ
jgi:hypothetical protein